MPKVSIYVPDGMKARLDRVGEAANWSAIAQRAFDVELEHLETVKEIGSMTDVIERLRASKRKFADAEMADARECGVDWAKQHAEFDELRRIAAVDTEGLDQMTGYAAACHVYSQVTDTFLDHRTDDELAGLFMIDEAAVRLISLEFVKGFTEGAIAIWGEVADQI